MHSAVLVIVNLSACPSVICLSVTLVDCAVMVRLTMYDHDFFTIWQPPGSSFLAPNFVSSTHFNGITLGYATMWFSALNSLYLGSGE